MDLHYLFKGVSEEFQISGSSIIGQFSKKAYLMEGFETVRQNGGQFLETLTKEIMCALPAVVSQNNDPIYVPCRTLRNIESASGVKWHGHILKGKNENDGE